MYATLHQLGQPADDSTVASNGFVAAAVVLITLAFMCPLKQSWTMSVDEMYTRIFVDYAQYDRSDEWMHSAAIAMLGLFGLGAFLWPGGRPLQAVCSIAMVWTAYIAFSAMSCALNDAPAASLKRYVGDLCGILLALGIARRASLRQFVWIVFLCSFSWLALGLVAEVTQGTFRPWSSDHRFAGLFHPNGMGDACALAILAAMQLLRHEARYRIPLWAAIALSFTLLVLTRSRTAAVVLILILGTPWLVRTVRRHVVLAVAGFLCVATVGVMINSSNLIESANSSVFGREEKDVTLAGRDQIWKELVPYIAERPFVGYGYGFWSTDLGLTEPAQSAHSLYVDAVVHFGLLGAVLYLWGMALAMRRTVLSAQRWPECDFAFVASIILYLLIRGLTESAVGFTGFSAVFVMCGIGFMIFREGFDACPVTDSSYRRPNRLSARFPRSNGTLRIGDH